MVEAIWESNSSHLSASSSNHITTHFFYSLEKSKILKRRENLVWFCGSDWLLNLSGKAFPRLPEIQGT